MKNIILIILSSITYPSFSMFLSPRLHTAGVVEAKAKSRIADKTITLSTDTINGTPRTIYFAKSREGDRSDYISASQTNNGLYCSSDRDFETGLESEILFKALREQYNSQQSKK